MRPTHIRKGDWHLVILFIYLVLFIFKIDIRIMIEDQYLHEESTISDSFPFTFPSFSPSPSFSTPPSLPFLFYIEIEKNWEGNGEIERHLRHCFTSYEASSPT